MKTANSRTTQDTAKKLEENEREQEDLPTVKEVPKIKLTEENLLEYGRFSWWHEGDGSKFFRRRIVLLTCVFGTFQLALLFISLKNILLAAIGVRPFTDLWQNPDC